VYPDVDVGAALLPSARYLGLLRDGAAEWNLAPGWRRYLNTAVSPYAASTPGQMIGGAVAAASLAPLVVLAAPLGLAVAAENLSRFGGGYGASAGPGTSTSTGAGVGAGAGASAGAGSEGDSVESMVEEAVVQGFKAFSGVTWGVHNALWAPLFGSGANNSDAKGGKGGVKR
jgi:hypothetical protein